MTDFVKNGERQKLVDKLDELVSQDLKVNYVGEPIRYTPEKLTQMITDAKFETRLKIDGSILKLIAQAFPSEFGWAKELIVEGDAYLQFA
jgi:hypothetical protein